MNDKKFLNVEFGGEIHLRMLKRGYYVSTLGEIQNGHHEITEVNMNSLIIEIETKLFHQTTSFRYQGMR